jgi:hypothetical protein
MFVCWTPPTTQVRSPHTPGRDLAMLAARALQNSALSSRTASRRTMSAVQASSKQVVSTDRCAPRARLRAAGLGAVLRAGAAAPLPIAAQLRPLLSILESNRRPPPSSPSPLHRPAPAPTARPPRWAPTAKPSARATRCTCRARSASCRAPRTLPRTAWRARLSRLAPPKPPGGLASPPVHQPSSPGLVSQRRAPQGGARMAWPSPARLPGGAHAFALTRGAAPRLGCARGDPPRPAPPPACPRFRS